MHAWLSRKHFSPNGFSGSLVMFMDIQLTLAFMNFAGANYMIQKTTVVSVDPIIQIGVVNISEVRFKASMAMSRSQMLRGVLGFWSPLMTALGSTENMPVRSNQRFNESICTRQSTRIGIAVSNIEKGFLANLFNCSLVLIYWALQAVLLDI
ncbi:hypothetical protein NC651_024878 [Populus alba x Populus x berolinensis]|nr:hypothetical protein NC651_024878 [Populus alba x Populus x berolinensis]